MAKKTCTLGCLIPGITLSMVLHKYISHTQSMHFLLFQNIKLSSMRAKAAEDLADEGDVAGAAIVQARNKFLTQVNSTF